MVQEKKKADIIRTEKKKQLMRFIESRKVRMIPPEKYRIRIQENRKVHIPDVNKENVPKEAGKTYIEGSNRRKKRREKLQEFREKREEIKKKRALAAQKKKEEREKIKLEALKKREEARQLKELKKRELLQKRVLPSIPPSSNKKKEDLLSLINKIKEKHQIEYTRKLLQKQVILAEKKAKAARKKEEREKIKLEALKKPSLFQRKRKEELLEFIKTRKRINEQLIERKRILKQVPVEKPVKILPPEIVPVVIPPAVRTKISNLSKESRGVEVDAKNKMESSFSAAKKFISEFTKKKKVPEKLIPAAEPEKKVLVKYREPFLLVPFIRRNIFKFVFLILLITWLWELFSLMEKFQEPQKRLSDIIGEDITSKKSPSKVPVPEEVLPETEAQPKIAFKKERINIEGKRDPFSPGQLTMEVFEKPETTNIVLASKPEIISILKPQKVVSIIREERRMEPEKIATASKPPTPSYKPIVKSQTTPPQPLVEKPTVAEVSSPLVIQERKCELIYRGRLVMEGVEYLFIEGKDRTYRVTVGDVVEGFRILRKEKDKIYLSKEGIIYEIQVD